MWESCLKSAPEQAAQDQPGRGEGKGCYGAASKWSITLGTLLAWQVTKQGSHLQECRLGGHLRSRECADSMLLLELCGGRHHSLGIIVPRATPSHIALLSAVMGLRVRQRERRLSWGALGPFLPSS